MAFNLLDLFAPAATNRLINPAPIGNQPQNMLVSRDIPQDPQISQSFPLPAPAVDPQTTAAIQSPAPQPVAGTQVASAAPSNPSFLDKYQQFWDSDRGSRLRDMFAGWAMGSTPQQSLALGAANMASNSKERTAKNQTLAWLKGKGVSDDEATFLAGNPTALGDYLKNIYAAQRNQGLLNVGKGAALYDPNSKQWITPPEGIGGSAQDEYGLNPIFGKDANGNTVIAQLGKNGTLHQPQLPTGFIPTPGISNIDTGTGTLTINNKTGTPIANTPKDVAGAKQQAEIGSSQGQAQAAYNSMSSKLPGLESVISKLDDLADKATYTTSGQWLDWGRKELGMNPREAALARTDYISTVDNQVLPLLRETFGAAFTEKEGNTLRNTLGDPNKTPAEKKIVLHSFIEQKKRDIAALAAQTGVGISPQQQQAPAAANTTSSGIKWSIEP